jgi:hypothetical protein
MNGTDTSQNRAHDSASAMTLQPMASSLMAQPMAANQAEIIATTATRELKTWSLDSFGLATPGQEVWRPCSHSAP